MLVCSNIGCLGPQDIFKDAGKVVAFTYLARDRCLELLLIPLGMVRQTNGPLGHKAGP